MKKEEVKLVKRQWTTLVRNIMLSNPDAVSNDKVLYNEVIKAVVPDYDRIGVEELLDRIVKQVPSYETISRTRRLLQRRMGISDGRLSRYKRNSYRDERWIQHGQLTLVVWWLLINKPATRDNDNILYVESLKNLIVNYETMNNKTLLDYMVREMPPFETIARIRRKLQRNNEELRGGEYQERMNRSKNIRKEMIQLRKEW